MSSESLLTEKCSDFSERQKSRMNEDLETLSSITTSVRDIGIRSLVEFGYGVEAVSSHEITRFHHDTDIALVLPLLLEEQSAYTELPARITESTGIEWESVPTERKWIWLRSADKHMPELPKHVNIHFFHSEDPFAHDSKVSVFGKGGKPFDIRVAPGNIRNFDGNIFNYEAPTPEEIAAAKIRLIPAYREKGGAMRNSDASDISRLLHLKTFDMQECERILVEFLVGTKGMSQTEALIACRERIAQFR